MPASWWRRPRELRRRPKERLAESGIASTHYRLGGGEQSSPFGIRLRTGTTSNTTRLLFRLHRCSFEISARGRRWTAPARAVGASHGSTRLATASPADRALEHNQHYWSPSRAATQAPWPVEASRGSTGSPKKIGPQLDPSPDPTRFSDDAKPLGCRYFC